MRKQWDTSKKEAFVPKEPRKPVTRVAGAYDEYLNRLQQRNKYMKQLQEEDSRHIELERREKGFTVYLNGANSLSTQLLPTSRSTVQQRATKTADPSQLRRDSFTSNPSPEKSPSKISPSKRKSWSNTSVNLKTQSGERVQVHAPDMVTGCYDDDFEVTEEERAMVGQEGGENEEILLAAEGLDDSLKDSQEDVTELLEVSTNLDFSATSCDYFEESSVVEELAAADEEQEEVCGGSDSDREVCLELRTQSAASTVLSVARKLSEEEVVDDSIVAAVEFENKLSSAWKESSIPQDTTAPTQDTLRSIQDTASAAQATATSTQDTTLSDTHSFMKTAQYIAEPAQDTTTKRTQVTIEHAQDTTKRAQDTTKCAQDTPPITQSHSLSDSLENIAEPSSNEQIRLSTVDRQRNGRAEKQLERKMVSTAAGGGPGHHGAGLLQSSLTEHTLRVVTERVKRMDSQKQAELLSLLSAMDTEDSSQRPTTDTTSALTALSTATTKNTTMEPAVKQHTTSAVVSSTTRQSSSTPQPPPTTSPPAHLQSSLSLPAWLTETSNTTTSTTSKRSVDDSLLDAPLLLRRLQSGRRTGVRGELVSSHGCGQLQSSSDSNLHTFLDRDDDEPRLKTAVISKGRRARQRDTDNDLLTSSEVVMSTTKPPSSVSSAHPLTSSSRDHTLIDPQSPSPRSPTPKLTDSLSSVHDDTPRQISSQSDLEDKVFSQLKRRYTGSSDFDGEAQFDYEEEEEVWSFPLPELPSGQVLTLNLLTTWGDTHYIGLTGVEVYDSQGEHVAVKEISASPASINVLPEYSNDPRVATNLLDGVNMTRDDLHMWLAPFTPDTNHTVTLSFPKPASIAMIRIWNYNKSRIHSFRGAKDVQLFLDNQLIFSGEIAKACGQTHGEPELFGETILFTADEDVLAAVAAHDVTFPSPSDTHHDLMSPPISERPSTADTSSLQLPEAGDERPFTAATPTTSEVCLLPPQDPWTEVKGQVIVLTLLSSWRGTRQTGLTGVEVLDSTHQPLPLTPSQLCVTHSGGEAPGVLDGVNLTTGPDHMWLSPPHHDGGGEEVSLSIELTQVTELAGLRVWNYNRSLQDSFMGVRLLDVHIDGRQISPPGGYMMRRAPGNDHYDYHQLISFSPTTSSPSSLSADTNDCLSPCGFVYQLQLLSSWGDPYYIGLTGLELYDEDGKKIQLGPSDVAAYPESVNVLQEQGDVRTPDKLVDGVCESDEWSHTWLSPLLPRCVNTVYVVFDSPRTVSRIKIWNYAKTPSRGVREFSVLVDDLLVHTGVLPMTPRHSIAILPTITPPLQAHTVSLSSSSSFTDSTSVDSNYHVLLRRDSLVVSDESVVGNPHGTPSTIAAQEFRPTTSLVLSGRQKHRHRF